MDLKENFSSNSSRSMGMFWDCSSSSRATRQHQRKLTSNIQVVESSLLLLYRLHLQEQLGSSRQLSKWLKGVAGGGKQACIVMLGCGSQLRVRCNGNICGCFSTASDVRPVCGSDGFASNVNPS